MIARVYQAINAVAGAMSHDGVAKTRLNARDNYLYRSIDDVLERLAPLLAQHRLCILPRVLERSAADRHDEHGQPLVAVALKVAFDLVSAEDGSRHTIEAYGEALDAGDKATAKAMQSAYKYAVLQAFCVPAAHGEDPDARSHRLKAAPAPTEPAEGWPQWCEGLQQAVALCADEASVQRLQEDHRPSLAALAREKPELYSALGQAIGAHRLQIEGAAERSQHGHGSKGSLGPGSITSCEPADTRSVKARRKRSSRVNGSGAHA